MTTTTADPTLTYPIVTEQQFPDGILCAGCRREIPPGDPLANRRVGVTADGDTIADLVCTGCAYGWGAITKETP